MKKSLKSKCSLNCSDPFDILLIQNCNTVYMQTIKNCCLTQTGIQLCMSQICPGGCTCITTPVSSESYMRSVHQGNVGRVTLALKTLITRTCQFCSSSFLSNIMALWIYRAVRKKYTEQKSDYFNISQKTTDIMFVLCS